MVFRKHVRTVQVVQGVCAHHRKNETMKPPSQSKQYQPRSSKEAVVVCCMLYTPRSLPGCILYIEVYMRVVQWYTHTHTHTCMYESYVCVVPVCCM